MTFSCLPLVYPNDLIDILNKYGMLSITLIMRISKCDHENAKNILSFIVEDYENVHWVTENHICIEGRESANFLRKENKPRTPRKSKWKDVMRP